MFLGQWRNGGLVVNDGVDCAEEDSDEDRRHEHQECTRCPKKEGGHESSEVVNVRIESFLSIPLRIKGKEGKNDGLQAKQKKGQQDPTNHSFIERDAISQFRIDTEAGVAGQG